MPENTINQHRFTEMILQIIRYTNGENINAVSVDSEDSNRLNIRLGKQLGFISQIILADGRVVSNMSYSAAKITAAQIIETFKGFGAAPPPCDGQSLSLVAELLEGGADNGEAQS